MCIFRHHFLGWCSWPVQPWLALCLAPLTLRPVRWKPRAQSQWTWLFCSLLQFHWRSVCSYILYFITAPIINEWMVINKKIPVTGTTPNSPVSLPKSPTFPSASGSWQDECSICYENTVDTVIYACGHMCLCYTCGLRLKKMANASCPICRRAIKDIIKTYRST